MRIQKNVVLTMLVCLLVGLLVVSSSAAEKKQFKVWWFEPNDNAMGISWNGALEKFKAAHPDVEVLFEQKSFEETQKTARMVLNTDEAPDIMQTNKGNGTAGQYVKDGLLTNLEAVAKERGWDKVLSPSVQATCRYSAQGLMGSGDLYGITTYGEFVMVYYNQDLFDKFGLKVPTTLAELEKVADTFVANKIAPFALGGSAQWPATHNWFELVLYKADRKLVNGYQTLANDVDLKGEAFLFGTQKLAEYVKKGYFDPNVTGIDYDGANQGFLQQTYPMSLTGSWMYKWSIDQLQFNWDVFLMPNKNLNTGSGGNLFVVPQKAKNKDLAYDFIDLVLASEAQTAMANAGGLPLNADVSKVSDPKIQRLNELFSSLVKNDALSFYPDWPVPNFMEVLGGNLQELLSGSKDANAVVDALAQEYNAYRDSM